MRMRARLKRQAAERAKVVYLNGLGVGVPYGSVVLLGVRHPYFGRKPFAVGWVLADTANPIVHWGKPVARPKDANEGSAA